MFLNDELASICFSRITRLSLTKLMFWIIASDSNPKGNLVGEYIFLMVLILEF